ncbi:hypothetical protein CHELA20_51313 [Hyphomicrobiales bacterium]|nr:hypothetical protein CHELA41_23700 [Hyphomicrobiales bacterium]CAH1675181.1 hypothetical protein CHELA20_51313 [Hyphomicrobiales bacterium]
MRTTAPQCRRIPRLSVFSAIHESAAADSRILKDALSEGQGTSSQYAVALMGQSLPAKKALEADEALKAFNFGICDRRRCCLHALD